MYTVNPIGHVSSPLTDRSEAPKQGDEGAPEAWLVIESEFADAARDLRAGHEILVLTWLHRAERDVMRVRPRDNPNARLRGVFSTRSPDRPNPIGIHRTTIVAVDGETRFRVSALEAIDGTPILDVKPVLRPASDR